MKLGSEISFTATVYRKMEQGLNEAKGICVCVLIEEWPKIYMLMGKTPTVREKLTTKKEIVLREGRRE